MVHKHGRCGCVCYVIICYHGNENALAAIKTPGCTKFHTMYPAAGSAMADTLLDKVLSTEKFDLILKSLHGQAKVICDHARSYNIDPTKLHIYLDYIKRYSDKELLAVILLAYYSTTGIKNMTARMTLMMMMMMTTLC